MATALVTIGFQVIANEHKLRFEDIDGNYDNSVVVYQSGIIFTQDGIITSVEPVYFLIERYDMFVYGTAYLIK